MEPRRHTWIIPERLAVAERPGGGGRAHRRERRAAELGWWRARGITTVVSCMPTRQGLLDAALAGIAVRWFPLDDPETGAVAIRAAADEVRALLRDPRERVLVHGDAATEWLTALRAGMDLLVGGSGTPEEALAAAEADGLPVGSLAQRLVADLVSPGAPELVA